MTLYMGANGLIYELLGYCIMRLPGDEVQHHPALNPGWVHAVRYCDSEQRQYEYVRPLQDWNAKFKLMETQ